MDIAMSARMMRLWTAETRFACFLGVTVPFAAFARTAVVSPLPVSPYADAEGATNLPRRASDEDAHGVELRFALDGRVSDGVQVAA